MLPGGSFAVNRTVVTLHDYRYSVPISASQRLEVRLRPQGAGHADGKDRRRLGRSFRRSSTRSRRATENQVATTVSFWRHCIISRSITSHDERCRGSLGNGTASGSDSGSSAGQACSRRSFSSCRRPARPRIWCRFSTAPSHGPMFGRWREWGSKIGA